MRIKDHYNTDKRTYPNHLLEKGVFDSFPHMYTKCYQLLTMLVTSFVTELEPLTASYRGLEYAEDTWLKFEERASVFIGASRPTATKRI